MITGGSSGIGLFTAQQILAEGGAVLITGTNEDKLISAAAGNANIHTLVNDASDLTSAGDLAAETKKIFGEIDGVFLNGGRGGIRTPDRLSPMPVFKTGAFNHSATHP